MNQILNYCISRIYFRCQRKTLQVVVVVYDENNSRQHNLVRLQDVSMTVYKYSLLEEGRKRIPELPQIWLVLDSGSGGEIE